MYTWSLSGLPYLISHESCWLITHSSPITSNSPIFCCSIPCKIVIFKKYLWLFLEELAPEIGGIGRRIPVILKNLIQKKYAWGFCGEDLCEVSHASIFADHYFTLLCETSQVDTVGIRFHHRTSKYQPSLTNRKWFQMPAIAEWRNQNMGVIQNK